MDRLPARPVARPRGRCSCPPRPRPPLPATCPGPRCSGASSRASAPTSPVRSRTAPSPRPASEPPTPYAWTGGAGSANGDVTTVAYPGSLHFSGHAGALDLTLSDVKVRITSATTAELVLDAVSLPFGGTEPTAYSDVVFASLDLAAGTNTTAGRRDRLHRSACGAHRGGLARVRELLRRGHRTRPGVVQLARRAGPRSRPLRHGDLGVAGRAASESASRVPPSPGSPPRTSRSSRRAPGTPTSETPSEVAITDGAFTQPLVAPTAHLDPAKQYEVVAWKTRSNPSASTVVRAAPTSPSPPSSGRPCSRRFPAIGTNVTAANAADGLVGRRHRIRVRRHRGGVRVDHREGLDRRIRRCGQADDGRRRRVHRRSHGADRVARARRRGTRSSPGRRRPTRAPRRSTPAQTSPSPASSGTRSSRPRCPRSTWS